MDLPSKILHTEDPPSKVISGIALSGSETVLFVLETSLDVYTGPGVYPVDVFFEKSPFLDTLQVILNNIGSGLQGPAGLLWEDIVENDAHLCIKDYIRENDFSDIISISCIEPVTGISTVRATIQGETKVSNLRALDKITLDKLFVEVITDYFLMQSSGGLSEKTL